MLKNYSREDILAVIKTFLSDYLDDALVASTNQDMSLINDLGLDSLDMCELSMALERQFGIKDLDAHWYEDNMLSHVTVGTMIDGVLSQLEKV